MFLGGSMVWFCMLLVTKLFSEVTAQAQTSNLWKHKKYAPVRPTSSSWDLKLEDKIHTR